MKSIFILYLPGHAGNFLTRVFSLGPDTVLHLPKDKLSNAVDTDSLPDVTDRLAWYRFSKVKEMFGNWQEFHRSWPDFYDRALFADYIKLLDRVPENIVYSIHPYEFVRLLPNICVLKSRQLFYVELDLTKYLSWVESASKQLDFVYRPKETKQFEQFLTEFNMEPISLTAMLDSEESFLKEYLRVCNVMSIVAQKADALELYRDWASVRK